MVSSVNICKSYVVLWSGVFTSYSQESLEMRILCMYWIYFCYCNIRSTFQFYSQTRQLRLVQFCCPPCTHDSVETDEFASLNAWLQSKCSFWRQLDGIVVILKIWTKIIVVPIVTACLLWFWIHLTWKPYIILPSARKNYILLAKTDQSGPEWSSFQFSQDFNTGIASVAHIDTRWHPQHVASIAPSL
jgi:hypothetical protein